MKKERTVLKRLNKIIKTCLKKLKTFPRNCAIKINLRNMKIIWKAFGMKLKKLLGKKKLISCTSSKLIVDNEEITDNSVFAEEFDNFFVDMGPNLASKIPVTNKHHSQFKCMFLSCHLRVSE